MVKWYQWMPLFLLLNAVVISMPHFWVLLQEPFSDLLDDLKTRVLEEKALEERVLKYSFVCIEVM